MRCVVPTLIELRHRDLRRASQNPSVERASAKSYAPLYLRKTSSIWAQSTYNISRNLVALGLVSSSIFTPCCLPAMRVLATSQREQGFEGIL